MPSTLPILLENGKRNGETESKNGTEAVTELGKEYIELSIYIFLEGTLKVQRRRHGGGKKEVEEELWTIDFFLIKQRAGK